MCNTIQMNIHSKTEADGEVLGRSFINVSKTHMEDGQKLHFSFSFSSDRCSSKYIVPSIHITLSSQTSRSS